jgi:predicted nucleic acid-binding Zn ribbon protein
MLSKARSDWQTELLKREQDIAYAIQTKSGMGNNYWHDERAARLRYEAMRDVVESME